MDQDLTCLHPGLLVDDERLHAAQEVRGREAIFPEVQGDQLYMAVCFWYLVKRDLSTSFTFYKVPE